MSSGVETPSTLVVTGAAGGMTALFVQSYVKAHPGNTVLCLVRDAAKVQPDVLPPQSDKVIYESFPMTTLSSVKTISQSIARRVSSGQLPKITAVVHSATIQITNVPSPRVTSDGYEETVVVAHLAHFILLLELLPAMTEQGRIVIIGSDSHRPNYKYFPKGAEYHPLKQLLKAEPGTDTPKDVVANGRQKYGTAKLLQTMIGNELARRLKHHPKYSSLRVIIFNPGSMGSTSLIRDRPYLERTIIEWALYFPRILNWLQPDMQVSLKGDSAATLLNLVTDPKYYDHRPIEENRASYWLPWGEESVTLGEANEEDKCAELWKDTVELLGYHGEQALL